MNFRGTSQHKEAVGVLKWRLASAMGLRMGLQWAGLWALAWGTVVLVLRYIWLVPATSLAWGLAGAVVAAIFAGFFAWKAIPQQRVLIAMLDKHNAMGGLLMAEPDATLGAWGDSLREIEIPQVTGTIKQPTMILILGLAFLIASLLTPDRLIRPDARQPMDVSKETAQLHKQIEMLAKHHIIEPKLAQSYRQQLEQISNDANGNDPAKTWEALDHLQTQAQQQAQNAAEKAREQGQLASQAQGIEQAIFDAGDKIDPGKLSQALRELGELAADAQSQNAELMDIPEELMKALENGQKLSPEQLKALRDAMKNSDGKISKMLKDLNNAKLVDLAQLSPEGEPCKLEDIEALKKYLCESACNSDCDGGNLFSNCKNGRPGGRRGGGPAQLTRKDESSDDGAKFKEVTLPAKDIHSLKDSKLAGLSAKAPKLDTKAEGSTHDALASAEASGGEAHAQTLLPHHQASVKRFFERANSHNVATPTVTDSVPSSSANP